MRTVQLYDTGAPGNNMAQVQVPTGGKLVGIQYAISGDLDSDAEVYTVALENVPTLQANTNEAQGTYAVWREQQGQAGAGDVNSTSGLNGYLPLPSIPVLAGQLLYLNGAGTASVVNTTLLLYIQ